jgi:tetratricopeptide (TPR) repeat protein
MTRWLAATLFCVLFSSIPAFSQGRKTPGRSTTTVPSRTPMESPTTSSSRGTIFLSGKVVLQDGTSLTEPAAIQTVCKGRKRTETYTDSHGFFSFQFGTQNPSATAAGVDDVDSSWGDNMSRGNQRDWRDCELQASLAGYSSDTIPLSTKISTLENSDVGRITLRRMTQVEGLAISATSAMAPGGAKKAFQKGREQEQKEKLDEAEKSFTKAVQIYPNYAAAWYELGQVQFRKKDVAAARHSWEQSLAADAKYVHPYVGLCQLEMQDKRWQELGDTSDKLLALDPVSFPEGWFWNGAANYMLHKFSTAEKSARQGLKLDEHHQLPKLEYLLGMALIQERAYPEASEHMQQFLQLTKEPAEVQEAQKQLTEIARLSGNPGSSPPQ